MHIISFANEGGTISEQLKRAGIEAHATDSVIYNEDNKELKLYGHATFRNKEIAVNANHITYNTSSKKGEAIGDVTIVDARHKIKTSSSHAYFGSK